MTGNEQIQNLTHDQARSAAVCYIGLDLKASQKVAAKLLKSGFPEDVVREVIRELTQEGLIDDQAYALSVIRSRKGKRAESVQALLVRLVRLGVPESEAKACLMAHYDHPKKEALEAAQALRLKFIPKEDTIPSMTKEERLQFMRRSHRFLISRGYSYENAYRAVKFVMKEYFPDDQTE